MKSSNGRIVQLLIDFIPIILVYLFATQSKEMIVFSNSSLGRFIAVVIILFYSSISPVYGFFICAVIVLYYQTDMVGDIVNRKKDIRFEEGMMNLTYELWNGPSPTPVDEPMPTETQSSFGFYTSGDSGIYDYVPFQTKNELNEDKLDKLLPRSINPDIAKSNVRPFESFTSPPLGKTDIGLFPWK